MTARQWVLAGMALIFCGLLAIDGRLRRRSVAVGPRARSMAG